MVRRSASVSNRRSIDSNRASVSNTVMTWWPGASIDAPVSSSTERTASTGTDRSAASALIRVAMPAARLWAGNRDVPRTRNSVVPSITTGADGSSASESATGVCLSSAACAGAVVIVTSRVSAAKISAQTVKARRRPVRARGVMAPELSSPRAGKERSPYEPCSGIVPASRKEANVKLVTFQIAGKPELLPGLFTDRGVVSLADAVPAGATPTAAMTGIIDDFDRLRPSLERLAREGKALPMTDVRLRAPLPRPGKILACIANYWEHGALEARPLNMFLKSADAVIGPGDTIVLPEFTEPWIFMHEAE